MDKLSVQRGKSLDITVIIKKVAITIIKSMVVATFFVENIFRHIRRFTSLQIEAKLYTQ